VLSLGVLRQNLIACDVKGVVYKGRPDLADPTNYLNEVACEDNNIRTVSEAIEGADLFLGLSVGNVFTPAMLNKMSRDPLVFALANPTPEINYHLAKSTRKDVIMATGRSDFPNQINNVCAFPFIFRGALDCHATQINEPMKLAATHAIASLAFDSKDDPFFTGESESLRRYVLPFGREFLLPKPFDPRLRVAVSAAVAEAAIQTGVARNIIDINNYKSHLLSQITV